MDGGPRLALHADDVAPIQPLDLDMTLHKIDLHLIRVLSTVPTERSVSRAAIRPGLYQPAVSASLKRLCALAGHSLLARSGAAMVPTAPQMGARGVMDEHPDKQGACSATSPCVARMSGCCRR